MYYNTRIKIPKHDGATVLVDTSALCRFYDFAFLLGPYGLCSDGLGFSSGELKRALIRIDRSDCEIPFEIDVESQSIGLGLFN